jgi:hypothetical protein
MNEPDAQTRRANRRLLAGIAIFALLLCGLVIFWKAFFT